MQNGLGGFVLLMVKNMKRLENNIHDGLIVHHTGNLPHSRTGPSTILPNDAREEKILYRSYDPTAWQRAKATLVEREGGEVAALLTPSLTPMAPLTAAPSSTNIGSMAESKRARH